MSDQFGETLIDEGAIAPEPEALYGGSNSEGWVPAKREREYALSVDLGQSFDPTAICLLRRSRDPVPPPEGISADLIQRLGDNVFTCIGLERIALGTNYVDVTSIVANRLAIARRLGPCELVLDASGV